MNYYEFNLIVSINADSEESAKDLIKDILESNDIDVEYLQCQYKEIYN